ncbi:uncharacterized protein TRAVEDRAFT_60998 [Trametes versicolor FP-101664 SS1]|uniref:uncharacterized protein n=1 Tax=Trametes versicolor (strain FP-101664) TaxID=717944 RepID=UPI0004621FB6|nr:uncharacterized protein TRAVEDRAFT_60998 [Trametes versicolor FP-101664 SS1]EIW53771.1 hypothetical protein TRAVEDRAFT_60998 [Trametes versicolor FP-101664 SS1]
MHARNPYQSPPDFLALADAHPALKPHIIRTAKGATIDFKDDAAQRALTEAILSRDFGLRVVLPPGRLCPPVTYRLNYILWLEDVLAAVALALGEDPDRPVRGIDVGTGASAIYPLLGCRTRPNWSFVATEIDALSLRSARENVRANALEGRISIREADPAGHIFGPLFESDGAGYDFTMCNPPFYGSREEVQQSAEGKEHGPNAVCTGADVEMITPGGEAAFVARMVEESTRAQDRCRWFTSMLGKLSSLAHVVQALRDHKIENYAVAELVQGQTRRWVLAWSFADVRLPDTLARLSHHGTQHLTPARNTLHQPLPLPPSRSLSEAASITRTVLTAIPGLTIRPHSPTQSPEALDVAVSAAGCTWSRAARRRRRDSDAMHTDADPDPALVCRMRCEERGEGGGEEEKGEKGAQLVFDWTRGRDRALFEGLASHVGRKVVAGLSSPSISLGNG